MRLEDLVVEVRDKSLDRKGIIQPGDLDLQFEDVLNNVGTWKLTLAADHPLTPTLRTPGSGLIVTDPTATPPYDVLFSGPTIAPEVAATPEDPGGTVTFEGVTDNIRLMDALALPDPSTGNTYVDGTTDGNDSITDDAETAIHYFVNANIGPLYAGTSGRAVPTLTLGDNPARGPVKTWKARYDVLGEKCAEIAALAALSFRIVQRGDGLVFETGAGVNRSDVIRLDSANQTLVGQKVKTSAPEVTHVIVAGQGEAEARQISSYWSAPSAAAATAWGRRVERFIDQRQSGDIEQHENAALAALSEGGYTGIAVQAVPNEDSAMRYGTDWVMGDLVKVVVDDTELLVYVIGMVLKANSDGFRVGIRLGTDYRTITGDPLVAKIKKIEQRVSMSEKAFESAVAPKSVVPFRMASGKVNVSVSSSAAGTSAISFPFERFSETPVLTATVVDSDDNYSATVSAGPTTTGATIRVKHVDNTSATATVTVHWIALQMTDTAATG